MRKGFDFNSAHSSWSHLLFNDPIYFLGPICFLQLQLSKFLFPRPVGRKHFIYFFIILYVLYDSIYRYKNI